MRQAEEPKEDVAVVVREEVKMTPPLKEPRPVDPVDEEEDGEDWGAVPAFLRRSKLK